MNLGRAFQPIGATSLADSHEPVSLAENGDLPEASGDAGVDGTLGAVVLDDYDRAYVLNLARTLRQRLRPVRWRARSGTTCAPPGERRGRSASP